MQQETAMEFYERVVEGTKQTKEISLEHGSGSTLDDVKMHPVDKRHLANAISRLPDEIFEAAERAEENQSEEELDEMSLNNIDGETIEAFEDLCIESLSHSDLAPIQMQEIIQKLSFEVLFELGSQIIDMSVDESDAVKDFHEQG